MTQKHFLARIAIWFKIELNMEARKCFLICGMELSLFKKIYDQSLEPVCKKYQLTRMELDILLFLANNPGYDTAKDIIERGGSPNPMYPCRSRT